jgi:hypothetical protein
MARNRIVRVTFQKCERGQKVRNPKLALARYIQTEKGVTLKRAFAILEFQNSMLKIQG